MPKLTLFFLPNCPYCRSALALWEKLKSEERYKSIELELHDEKKEADLANSLDYYYVPCFYHGQKKLHEGAINEREMRMMLDTLL